MQILTATDGQAVELAFAPDGRALVGTFAHQPPFLWDIPATTAPKVLAEYGVGFCNAITFSLDSQIVGWIRGRDQRVEFDRDTGDEREVQLLEPPERVLGQVTVGPHARLVVYTHKKESHFRCFEADDTGNWEERWVAKPKRGIWFVPVAGTNANQFFAWERGNNGPTELVRRSAQSGQVLASVTTPIHPDGSSWLAATLDGSEVATFRSATLIVWRVGEAVRKVKSESRAYYRAIAYHPTGKYLFTAKNDTLIRVFETESWTVVKQYEWKIGRLTAIAISPDGTLAAAGGERGQVVLWDVDL